MPLPGGVATFTLVGGPETDAAGAVVFAGTKGRLTPVDATGNPVNIVHVATGQELVPVEIMFTIAGDGTWTVGPLPYTDAAGLSVTGFQYRIAWDVLSGSPTPRGGRFSVPTGTSSPVKFASVGPALTVPTVLVPVGVASVVGQTGVVTGAQIATDATVKAAFDPAGAAAGMALIFGA